MFACRFVFVYNRRQRQLNGVEEDDEDDGNNSSSSNRGEERPLLGKAGRKGSLLNLSPGKELQPLPPKFVPPPALDCSPEGLKAETIKVWNKTRDKLPIGVDLPRLVRKIVVSNDAENILFSGAESDSASPLSSSPSSKSPLKDVSSSSSSSSSSSASSSPVDPAQSDAAVESANNARTKQMIFELLQTLSREIDPTEVETLEKEFKGLNGALDGDLSLFLRPLIEEYMTEEHRLIRLLKVCNQSILAAAVVRMKIQFGSSYNYKDNRGGWMIDIIIHDDQSVTVKHTKKEISWEKPDLYDSQHFTFSWSFAVDFPSSFDDISATRLVIENVEFLESVSPSKRFDILKAMQRCSCAELSPSCRSMMKHFEPSSSSPSSS